MTKAPSPTWRLITVMVLRPLLQILIRNKWQGTENIPRTGPVIFAPNHLSYLDWGTDALFFQANGRYPTFMIKASAFKIKFIGMVLRRAGQLPVHRGRTDAALVLKQAERDLADGAAVIIYPEGTATRDPELWPMVAKTGIARLALTTGAPVIPVAHWGTQVILPYGSKDLKLFPRKTVRTVAGPPVDLSRWEGVRLSGTALREATAAIMADVTALVADLRGETPPAVPYDSATGSRTIPAKSPAARLSASNGTTAPAEAVSPKIAPAEAASSKVAPVETASPKNAAVETASSKVAPVETGEHSGPGEASPA
ncbi:MAG: phospholipid/glycerol acyltransferase [Actinomycetia bacterium]|nr:phospholipid/glycerol acyltransferase [Actinomycetes bacterium]